MAEPRLPLMRVEEALAQLLDGVVPLPAETVPLIEAHHRVLAAPLTAGLTQPPFDASAMDGYAVRAADAATAGARLKIIGQAAAGHGFAGQLEAGTTVRIFTGAPLPAGANAIVIQEDTVRDGEIVTVQQATFLGENVRPAGSDIRAGSTLLPKGRRLTSRDLMLAASGGLGTVQVARRPKVAILATGDELVQPGTTPGPDQIVSSIPTGLFGMVAGEGANPLLLGIAGDSLRDLDAKIASAAGADILVTIGGASVGDHDLVRQALTARGLALAFWRIAMRPGKPLMYGQLGSQRVLGLPGNPVSAVLCAQIFLSPLIRAMQGATAIAAPSTGVLHEPLPANGPRQHYLRARVVAPGPPRRVSALPRQDSSLVGVLAEADCLIVVPPNAAALPADAAVSLLDLEG